MLLGCIADDFTGATDLANNLVRAGMRVVQTIGVPDRALDGEADAVVVSLKSRTTRPALAVEQSLAALRWLRGQGAAQIYFKVCSTFDSTERGNIGPVAEALLQALGTAFAPVCPAFPEAGRTVFFGHLFVGDVLLSDSGMRHHPLTPMTDANLVRVMQRQSQGRVGLIDHRRVRAGAGAIVEAMRALQADGCRFAIVDAIDNDDLIAMGRAFAASPLIVAGSGVAIGLSANHGLQPSTAATSLPPPRGTRAIVSGSCSVATNAQVQHFIDAGGAAFRIDPLASARGDDVSGQALAWAKARMSALQPVLFYATADASAVQAVQAQLGVAQAGEAVERVLSAIARGLVECGVGQLVVAGGETSGACVQALGIERLRIGPQIAPGVPWCHAGCTAAGEHGLHIALKSGNFGATDFFLGAFKALPV
jgi:3-dehydrotetronate 4-kinase